MGSFLLVLFVFIVVVGVKYKAQHPEADIPESSISGAKEFIQDFLFVLKSVKSSKEKKVEEEGVAAEVEKSKSEEKPAE